MDADTLTFLLRGGHMNMPDRIERGAWPHPPLKFEDVMRHLVGVLESEEWFPNEWKPDRVGEMGVIECRPWSYVYRCQRFHPTNPSVRADYIEKVFGTAEEAARCYLKWDLNLPGDLDGWKVVGNDRRRRFLNTLCSIARWVTGNDVGGGK
jgi:hypothetical protein